MENINTVIEGSFRSSFFEELFENSIYFPLAIFIIELLQNGASAYFHSADPLTLILTAILQGLIITFLKKKKPDLAWLGNLSGPLFYMGVEASLEGLAFFSEKQHIAYWIYSLLMTGAQFFSLSGSWLRYPFIFLENIFRALIPLILYILFDAKEKSFIAFLPEFYSEVPHIFLSVVLVLMGIVIALSRMKILREKMEIRELARQLKTISQWTLGSNLLSLAVEDETVFQVKRLERAVVFFDIRGFTSWSEKHSPEEVVAMLNEYYTEAEKIMVKHHPITIKYTADEILLVFKKVDEALACSLEISQKFKISMEKHDLGVGGGINLGPVVEGMIGGSEHKQYDVLGDTVNTAKRFCEIAFKNEFLLSRKVIDASGGRVVVGSPRTVQLKGKKDPIDVFSFENFNP